MPGEFHVTEFVSHATVEEFVEEDVAVSTLNSHPEDALFELVRVDISVESKLILILIIAATQLPKECLEHVLFNSVAPVPFQCEHFPYLKEFI